MPVMGTRSLRARDLGSAPSGFAHSRAGAGGGPLRGLAHISAGTNWDQRAAGRQAGQLSMHLVPARPFPALAKGAICWGRVARHRGVTWAWWPPGSGAWAGGMTLIKVPTLDFWGPCG